MLTAELAALSPASVGRLVWVAPFGLFDESEPVADFWARRGSEVPATWSARPAEFAAEELACPEGEDEVEWQLARLRALESAARLLWPTGDRGLRKRLRRVRAATLLVWGSEDAVVPPGYAKRFAERMQRAHTEIRLIQGAGHRVDFDAPDALASAALRFLGA